MNMKNSVTIPKKTTKLKRLTLLLPFLLLAVALSSCSDDGNDENGDPQEEYTNYDYILTCDDGNQYYVSELEAEGDSMSFVTWLKTIPYQLVDKSQLPDWIMNAHIIQNSSWGTVYVAQGEDVETGLPYYVSKSIIPAYGFYLFDHTGRQLNYGGYWFPVNEPDPMYTNEEYQSEGKMFYNSHTKNWRFIFRYRYIQKNPVLQ